MCTSVDTSVYVSSKNLLSTNGTTDFIEQKVLVLV